MGTICRRNSPGYQGSLKGFILGNLPGGGKSFANLSAHVDSTTQVVTGEIGSNAQVTTDFATILTGGGCRDS